MKRYGNHQELANLAAYMISDYAGYMNGEVVTLYIGEWTYNAGQFNKREIVLKNARSLIIGAVIVTMRKWELSKILNIFYSYPLVSVIPSSNSYPLLVSHRLI